MHKGPKPATLATSRTYDLNFPTKSWLVRPHLMDISLTHDLDQTEFGDVAMTEDGWARFEKKLAKQITPALEHKNQTSARRSNYRRAVEPDFAEDLLIAGLNYYALFSACERVLLVIRNNAREIPILPQLKRGSLWPMVLFSRRRIHQTGVLQR